MKRKRLTRSKIRWGRVLLVIALAMALALVGVAALAPTFRENVRGMAARLMTESGTATPHVVALQSGDPLVWGGLSWLLEGQAAAPPPSRRLSPQPELTASQGTATPETTGPQVTATVTTSAPKVTRSLAPRCPDEGVQLTAPGMGAVVAGKVEIRGTANIEGFQYYKLELGRGQAPPSWQVIGELHPTPVVKRGDLLGVWNSAAVEPGVYRLRLVVVNQTGNYPEPCQTWVRVNEQ